MARDEAKEAKSKYKRKYKALKEANEDLEATQGLIAEWQAKLAAQESELQEWRAKAEPPQMIGYAEIRETPEEEQKG